MWIFLYFCLALSFNVLQVKSEPRYKWEDYDGNVPDKAFSVSDDPDKPLYIGVSEVDGENCTGSLQPGAKEMIFDCKDKVYKASCLKNIKILTIEDPSKCKYLYRKDEGARSNMWTDFKKQKVNPVTCGTNKTYQKTTTMAGRTKTEDGSYVPGHVNYGIFRSVDNNKKRIKKYKDYDILVCEKSQ